MAVEEEEEEEEEEEKERKRRERGAKSKCAHSDFFLLLGPTLTPPQE